LTLGRIENALPSWWNGSSIKYLIGLLGRLGPADTIRLFELLSEAGGLSPPEARPWLEPPEREWPVVERILYTLINRAERKGQEIPRHLMRWLEQERELNTSSLFDD
jgi:hypothetical protein